MTLDERVLAERRALLVEKLAVVERLSGHLTFSLGRLAYPLASLDKLDPVSLESVSALVADAPELCAIAARARRYVESNFS